ncbi:MAG: DNA-binding response regulator [Proteobacteria bacterium]|nr:DNA-binding response regulator [Pseudomonadota bacterium]
MAKERILIVDDEEDILELVRYNLHKEGYQVAGVKSAEEAQQAIKNETPDLIVLDLMLPGMDGLDLCRLLKKSPTTEHISIVMLSAKGSEADVVSGLELGADDYLAKPFSPRVLVARLKNVLRRKREAPSADNEPVVREELYINPGRREVAVKGKPLELTNTEFKLLHLLARQPGWVFTRHQIVDRVHGEDYPVTDRSVDVQVVGLRKKLGRYGKFVETVRGVGYRFKG